MPQDIQAYVFLLCSSAEVMVVWYLLYAVLNRMGISAAESSRASWSENLSDVNRFSVVDTGSNCTTAILSLGAVNSKGLMEFSFLVLL